MVRVALMKILAGNVVSSGFVPTSIEKQKPRTLRTNLLDYTPLAYSPKAWDGLLPFRLGSQCPEMSIDLCTVEARGP